MQRLIKAALGRWSIYIDLEGFGNGNLYDKENQRHRLHLLGYAEHKLPFNTCRAA
jgi:hypothetical protein